MIYAHKNANDMNEKKHTQKQTIIQIQSSLQNENKIRNTININITQRMVGKQRVEI